MELRNNEGSTIRVFTLFDFLEKFAIIGPQESFLKLETHDYSPCGGEVRIQFESQLSV